MGPTDLHKAERAPCPCTHIGAFLLLNALASAHAHDARAHAHAYPLLRAQPAHERASRDTEAPRIPCCANNTTAHVRDISFYYYPRVRFLSLFLSFLASSFAVPFFPAESSSFRFFSLALGPRRPFAISPRATASSARPRCSELRMRWFTGILYFADAYFTCPPSI